jgi:hypothetical protein
MAASNPHQFPPSVHVSQHPCVQAKLSQLRSASTNARETKALVHEIATIVGCEALAGALTVQASGTVSLLFSAIIISPDSLAFPERHISRFQKKQQQLLRILNHSPDLH